MSRPGIAGPDLTETASLPGATIGGTGQFQGNGVRITDSQNGPSGQDPGTLHDIGFPIPIACIPTTDTTVGSNCGVNTTVNALAPGVNVDGNAAVWQIGEIEIKDAGPDGTRGNADDQLFETQGGLLP